MTITLTFEAETPDELDAQVREWAHRDGGSDALSPLAPTPPDNAPSVGHAPTNADYRRAITRIPRGKVAAYSVVSEVVRGDSHGSQKVAGLAANDTTLATAYRVVKMDGGIAAGFRWSDGRMGGADDGRRALEEEGIRFDIHGRVQPEFMLSADELREHYEPEQA
jgi:alkylated DNA nucleotide flippase Atl1